MKVGDRIRVYYGDGEQYWTGEFLGANDQSIKLKPTGSLTPWVVFPWAAIKLIMPEDF